MKKSTMIIIGVVVVLVILLFGACSSYNSMVTLNEKVETAWGNVENQYQRRFDLIPNLVETVKGYAKHESETFETVTRYRAGVDQATATLDSAYNSAKALKVGDSADEAAFNKYNAAQADLNRAFSVYVNAVREAYPELKANENFKDLQFQLEGTENRIANERRNYNEAVQAYNIKVKSFPSNIWAGMFGFAPKNPFKADEAAQTAPKVSF